MNAEEITFVSIEEYGDKHLITLDVRKRDCCGKNNRPVTRQQFLGTEDVWVHHPSGVRAFRRTCRALKAIWERETKK